MVYFKKIIILVFLFVFMFNNFVFGADANSGDTFDSSYYVFYNEQYKTQLKLISFLYSILNNGGSLNLQKLKDVSKILLREFRFMGTNENKFIFVSSYIPSSSGLSGLTNYIVYTASAPSSSQTLLNYYDSFSGLRYNNTQVYSNVTLEPLFAISYGGSGLIIEEDGIAPYSSSLPVGSTNVFAPEFIDFFRDLGIIGSSDVNVDFSGLEDIISSNNNQVNESLNNITEEQQKITEELQNQTQQQHEDFQELNNSINDNTNVQQETQNWLTEEPADTSIDISGFSDSGVNDVTASSLDNIFTQFYNVFSNWSSTDIVIPIKDWSFTIPATLTENGLSNIDKNNFIRNIISVVYYYIVSVFIFKYMVKLIKSFQTGSIMNTDNTNDIKTEIL